MEQLQKSEDTNFGLKEKIECLESVVKRLQQDVERKGTVIMNLTRRIQTGALTASHSSSYGAVLDKSPGLCVCFCCV